MSKMRGTTIALISSGAAALVLGTVLLFNPPAAGFGPQFGFHGRAWSGAAPATAEKSATESPWAYRRFHGRPHHGGFGFPAFLIGVGVYVLKPKKRGVDQKKEGEE
ncbi:MAG: hypothetical protein WCT14_19375 [Treponemataceae bacterium]